MMSIRLEWFVGAAVLFAVSCKPDAKNSGDFTPESIEIQSSEPEFNESMTTVNAQCMVMRKLVMEGSKREFYLLNICPEDVSAHHQAINIALPDEPSVTAYFDTIRSFQNEKDAREYAEINGIFDIYFEPIP